MDCPQTEAPPISINMALEDDKASLIGLKQQPKAITNPFYNATELDKQGKHKEAEKIYLELLNADFSNPVVLAALGMNCASMERNGLGAVLLQRALERLWQPALVWAQHPALVIARRKTHKD